MGMQEITFREVLLEELGAIKSSREIRLGQQDKDKSGNIEKVGKSNSTGMPEANAKKQEEDLEARAFNEQLIGLSFSGGGIRSATFNLGVLQALAKFDLLRWIDYLSTVSGGGYIGSWLAAGIHRNNLEPFLKQLRPEHPGRGEAQEIRWLRRFSNYLTPRMGLASGDTWAMVGTYVRNVLLNQVILFLVLAAALLAALVPVAGFRKAVAEPQLRMLYMALGLLWIALTAIVANVSAVMRDAQEGSWEAPASFSAGARGVHLFVVIPLLTGAGLLWAWWLNVPWRVSDGKASLCGAATFTGLWLAGWGSGWLLKWLLSRRLPRVSGDKGKLSKDSGQLGVKGFRAAENFIWIVTAAAAAGAFGGWLMARLARLVEGATVEQVAILGNHTHSSPSLAGASSLVVRTDHAWHAMFWGIPFVLIVFLLTEALHIGLAGGKFSEAAREWWARLGGLLLLWTVSWSALTFLALDAPGIVTELLKPGKGWIKWALTALWGGITGGGIIAGKSSKTVGRNSNKTLEIAGKLAPHVFVVGLLLFLSLAIHEFAPSILQGSPTLLQKGWPLLPWMRWNPLPPASGIPYWHGVENISNSAAGLCFVTLMIAVFLSWRIGTNDFSMHGFYRNRLVRCYLGASQSQRRNPQPFTGFDPQDDFALGNLIETHELPDAQGAGRPVVGYFKWIHQGLNYVRHLFKPAHQVSFSPYPGPYPIFNTSLNLVAGEELAWQKRKAASFVMTPRYCGYEFIRASGERVSSFQEAREGPITLGLAVATSGAAASPNMGYHSSPSLAFLMTFFNLRLGWWLGNPLYYRNWRKRGPFSGLYYLLCELFGHTNHKSGFVYLSDGGHFENLGIYELVRRRCRYIVACDAGEDHEMKFGDLGNAIEKCRTDFGVDIEIDVESLRREKESGKSRWHCAVGKIHYENTDPKLSAGTLIYLKASLTGDEPTDIQRYAAEHKVFPHQSTADQFFDESQFESYRMLGQHVAESVFEAVGEEKPLKRMNVQKFFVLLSQRWYPPSKAVASSFTRHTATYIKLIEEMRKNPCLAFLDRQVYPEWTQLMHAHPAATSPSSSAPPQKMELWLPTSEDDRRAGFYFCNEIIQLMEDVYVDLNLEQEYDHPDNRGWLNLFRHWSYSGMFCATWAISAGIYGARFQRFCERHMDLRLGSVQIAEPVSLNGLDRAQQDQLLNYWEVRLISHVLGYLKEVKDYLRVLPLQIVVGSPDRTPGDGRQLRFTFGFVLARIQEITEPKGAALLYFRVQNHLRRMGLGREALCAMARRYEIHEEVKWFDETTRQEILRSEGPAAEMSLAEVLPTHGDYLAFQRLLSSVPGGPRSIRG